MDYSRMNCVQLRAEASKLNIPGRSKMLKADLIQALSALNRPLMMPLAVAAASSVPTVEEDVSDIVASLQRMIIEKDERIRVLESTTKPSTLTIQQELAQRHELRW